MHPRSRSRKPGGPCASVIRDAVGFAGCIGTSQQAARPRPAWRRWGELGREQQTGKLGRAWGRGPAGHLFLPRVRLARIGRSAARHRKWPAWVARDTRQQLRFCALNGAAPRAQRRERGRHPLAVRPLWFRHALGRRVRDSRPGAGVLTVGPPLTRVCCVTLDFMASGGSSFAHGEGGAWALSGTGPNSASRPYQPGNWRSRFRDMGIPRTYAYFSFLSLFSFFLWYSIP